MPERERFYIVETTAHDVINKITLCHGKLQNVGGYDQETEDALVWLSCFLCGTNEEGVVVGVPLTPIYDTQEGTGKEVVIFGTHQLISTGYVM